MQNNQHKHNTSYSTHRTPHTAHHTHTKSGFPMEDVDWAVQYMYAQYQLKGVAHVEATSTGPECSSP